MATKAEEVKEKAVEKIQEVKSKYPTAAKIILTILAALLMAGIGFFGGIFGLNEEQIGKLKQIATNTAIYQEAVAPAVVDSAIASDSAVAADKK